MHQGRTLVPSSAGSIVHGCHQVCLLFLPSSLSPPIFQEQTHPLIEHREKRSQHATSHAHEEEDDKLPVGLQYANLRHL